MAFSEIKKNFGFGMMRLPMNGKDVDYGQVNVMVDRFLESGFNYFDTAHGYLDGLSEVAFRECVAKRYDRSNFLVTDKLTSPYFKNQGEIRPFFESQLKACGVDYFDFYLMHAQTAKEFESFKERKAYETSLELKAEGKIRHFGISFHDKASVLEQILTEYPQIEVVQIQFNYIDYDDESVEARKVYEVCRKYNKPVIIMEPVKGGSLVNLPQEGQKILDNLRSQSEEPCSNAGYALRYCGSFEGVEMILSGMSSTEQMDDNIRSMKDFNVLSKKEMDAVQAVSRVFSSLDMIKCTACHYCVEENHCPKDILIPDIFACMNKKQVFKDWNMDFYYNDVLCSKNGKAGDCIKCGKCEKVCPQHLPIRKLLDDVVKVFGK